MSKTPLTPAEGAVFEADDIAPSAGPALVPAHYGDPSGEQWALEAGRALVDRADLAVITVTGPDRATWLTSITSQVLTGMTPEDSRELLVLDPQGHVEYAATASDDGETLWLITEGENAEALAQWLDSMRFMLRVEVAVRGDVTVLGSVGDASLNGMTGSPGWVLTWADPWPGVAEGGTQYHQGRHPGEAATFYLHIVRADQVNECVAHWIASAEAPSSETSDSAATTAASNAQRPPRPIIAPRPRHMAGLLAWEAARIAAWRPRATTEVDGRTIPAEVDWLRTAVHIDKGCYRGQESIARVLNLGRPPRRLTFLHLDGSRGDLPEVGAAIERKGRRVGTITSVARHADLGPIALALISRNIPSDEVFDLDGIAAAQELIIPLDGRATASPKERPGLGHTNPELRRPDVPATGGGGSIGGR
ncbi:MAG: folate-binding protein [Actinomycetaceae bacterium]|nr:folate-binding protein [Actinomycetaceae bacterium]